MKKPYLSKTLWLNLLVAVSAMVYPPAAEFIKSNPVLLTSLFAGLNMVLRLVTKEKLSLGE